jgi:hypothetical protein
VPRPQETSTTEEYSRRSESKLRVPDDFIKRTKDVASSNPKETEFQTTNKRQKQKNTQNPKGKQQRDR